MRSPAHALLFLPMIVVLSCSTKISNVEHDPTFSEVALEAGGVAIGGITTVEATEDPQDMSRRYGPVLRRKIHDKRPIPVREWGEVKRLLGDDAMAACLAGYRDTGRVDSLSLQALHEGLGDTRYVVFARVEGNLVERDETDVTEMRDGKMVTVGHKRKTKRKVTVQFRVYDLTTGTDVWSASIEGKGENEKTVAIDDEDKGVLETIVDALLEDDTASAYPDPPDLSDVLEKIFGRFAKQVAVVED